MKINAACSEMTPGKMVWRRAISSSQALCLAWVLLLLVKHGTAQSTALNEEFNTEEEQPVGTYIGTIGEMTPEAPPPYILIYPFGETEADLDTSDLGRIQVKRVLDRESTSRYEFVAVSTTSGRNIHVRINVLDINDHHPTFNQSVLTKQILESTPRDVKFALGSAIDPDLDINSTQRYEIMSGNINNAFRLGSKQAPNGILYLDLEVNGELDYETIPSYDLVINAYDGANPPKFGTMNLHIVIVDVNDNQPTFNQSRYFAQVAENIAVGSQVLQVFASDLDSGVNGEIHYLIDRQRSDQDEQFNIDPTRGIMYINKELDFETQSSYELIVVAQDNGTQRLQTTAIVSVTVLDVNDNRPSINIIFIVGMNTDDSTARIPETMQAGEFVARISVSDPDVDDYYSNVSVTLNGGDGHFGLTTRDNVVYLVILSQPLDREMEPFYTLTVVATDSGSPPLESQKSFTIMVMDDNDNPPEFTQATYYADIQEVLPIGSSVIQVAAVDRDEGNNSQIRYELLDTPETHSDWFRIDSSTGLIMTATRVDCETSAEPRLTIRATDSGVPPLSALATVIVHIRDVNDNQPIFDQSFYNVSVPENQLVGTCILQVSENTYKWQFNAMIHWLWAVLGPIPTASVQFWPSTVTSWHIQREKSLKVGTVNTEKMSKQLLVSATDPDCGINGQVTYTIALNMGFEPPHELNVRNTTGQVCVAQPLDFETKPSYEFPIMARDQDGLDTIAFVKISLQDINDNSPVFMPSQYNVNIEYDGRNGDEVVAVAATDVDSGNFGTITYSIVSGNSLGLFNMHSQTGVITLNGTPSSSIHIYTLQVRATDGGGLWDQADVTVNVLDPSQQPPAFTESLYQMVVAEGVSSGALVGTISAQNTNPAAGAIIYSIVSGDTHQYFTVDASTGQIRTRNTLDHDTVPYVLMTVQAQSGTPPSFGRAQVNVTIGDINDNAPVFSVPMIQLPLREDTQLNTPIYYVQATDADSKANGRVTYSLQDPSGNFFINAESGQLKLMSSLDYEQSTSHSLLVVAEDGGMPPQQTTMTIDIDVQDVNDNTPTFTQTTYTASVMETAAINTQFTHVTASDRDAGNNGRITYLLAAGQSVDLFGVYPDTGYLYTQGQLDRELSDHYTVIVVAMDNGIPPRSSTATVQINILDENDNSPVFQEDEYHFGLEETQQSGMEVGYVSASDPDLTDNKHIQYSILSGNLYFGIDQSTGRIYTRRAVDRETQQNHTFRVEASDLGSPPHTAVVTVQVQVLDVNDNPPSFPHSNPYLVSITENKKKGSQVALISSSDPDVGANAVITYSFSPADSAAQYFAIDAQTGNITTREVLDAEAQSLYTLHVIAKDGGVPSRQSELTVRVTVLDVNDSPPEFPSRSKTITVEENTEPGVIIGSVHAVDSDSGENAHIYYYIIGGNLFGTFAINRTTGDIITEIVVDYEISSNYTMVVLATDNSALNPLTSQIIVHITVIDKNDNAPKFLDNPVMITVQENRPVNTEVYTFRAQDPDSGSYGNVRYAILSQSPTGNWFSLDPATGILSVNQLIDYEVHRQFSIVVQAADQPDGANSLSSSVTALINIEDVNDNPPIFQTRTEIGIMEDEPEGYPVLHVIATDADDHDNGRVTYAFVSGNELGHFALDANTGLLTVVHMLDHEDIREFHLNISARDHGYPMHISYVGITLSVMDVNDNPPRMEQAVYTASVEENKPWGTFVTQIHATDSDTGMNAQLTYLIPPGIADNKFKVGLTSGDITTNATLDREVQDSWVITAYVRDNAFPALYDTTTINVQVIDMNDNAPEFTLPLYYLELPENEDISEVHAVLATDADKGAFAEITYSISQGNVDGRFSINTDTGMLSCTALDREVTASYELLIQATDGGTPSRTSTATVMVDVKDDNDNNPLFTSSYYSASIAENVGPGRSILQVSASDGDEANNAMISFSLNNTAEGLFSINNVTGEIKTAGNFDREKKASYTFEVYAIDGGRYGPRTAEAQIEITILDINDNAPVFDQIPYRVNTSQNQGSGQFVTKVIATDADFNMNGDVRYSFSTSSVYFDIDSPSGIITTRQQLGSAAVGMHRLEIVATDRGQPALSSTGVAEIYVGSSGGSSDLRFSTLQYTASISESAPAGFRITQVSATFVTGSGTISYSIVSGNDDGAFYIAASTGIITVSNSAALDFEVSPQQRLIIMASSGGSFGYATVIVNLQDANDNAPRFMQDTYISAVWEGNSRGTYVTQIQATDADQGSNANIMYTIIGGNIQEAFVIDEPYTGVVKTNIILDREILDSYRLEIEAMDEGNPPLTSHCTLKIQVVDVNDNAPFFPQYTPISIPEGTALGTQILQVTANDRDLSPTLIYDFMPDGNPGRTFSIDRYSGRISVAKQLDYEQQRTYGLKITASDREHEVLTEVTVNVQDENDNPPIFQQQSYQVTLEETTAAQTSVVAVTAQDLDDGQNGNVTYTMTGSQDFYINAQTGVIYTEVEVVFNPSLPMVHLVVVAKDHGTPQLNAVIAVRIQIVDINNHAPLFEQAGYEENISENYPVGSSVISVIASDADAAYENRKLDYTIVSGNVGNKFQITSSTGQILLTTPLDREVTNQYSLTVMARDHGTPPQSSTVTVIVNVDDVNDNAPQFTQDVYTRTVREDIQEDTSILTVSAEDNDAGLNAQVHYSFTSGNDDEKFEIDSLSGTIYIKSKLDAEAATSHRLVVQAIDSSQREPQLSSMAQVVINVSDVNEYTPDFPVMMYLENVEEQLPLGTSVFTAHANDKDAGYYGEIMYAIESTHHFFTINVQNGTVRTAHRFAYYDGVEPYTFNVTATDKGGRTDRVPCMVAIEPGSFKPMFTQTQYDFSVDGNAKEGDLVGTVQASDADGNPSLQIHYRFKEEHEYFGIHPQRGRITVIKDLQGTTPSNTERRRKRRALQESDITLTVVAETGVSSASQNEVDIQMSVNRDCAGCAVPLVSPGDESTGGGLDDWQLVVIILFIIVGIVAVVVVTILYLRGRERKRHPPEEAYGGSLDSMNIHPPPLPRDMPPNYNEIHHYAHHGHTTTAHNMTTSEISDQSHSASSGRGSAEDGDDVDEEIRMINATPMTTSQKAASPQGLGSRMPDSGIQQDDDTQSLQSVQNHQEYLARLGIDSSAMKSPIKPVVGSSVESMHTFTEQGGGEAANTPHHYHKLEPMEGPEHDTSSEGTREFRYVQKSPGQAGSLSSVINSEEEFSGSYNWDYLLDWGPQYQPLAHVFAEIAKLKDDSIKPPKKQPTHIVPQRQPHGGLVPQVRTIIPPPLLTSAPPKAIALAQPVTARPNHGGGGSQRTSQMTSVPTMPRSPIIHESSFTSPAMSPSFTPSLSPLATRSPSISPLGNHKAPNGTHPRDHSMPSHAHRTNANFVAIGNPDAEQEIHI